MIIFTQLNFLPWLKEVFSKNNFLPWFWNNYGFDFRVCITWQEKGIYIYFFTATKGIDIQHHFFHL